MSIHNPMAFTFGILGNIISFMVFLAPVPTFIRIVKKKSTEDFQSLPYLVALFSSMLWLYYALLQKDTILLVTINSFGCVIETAYIAIYIVYATRESRVSTTKLLISVNVGLLSLILLLTHFLVDGPLRVQVLGWLCVVVSVCVFAAPLNILKQVVRTKSVEFMPFTLSFFLTLSAVMWFAYGFFLKDLCVALPNVLGFILGLLQMLLYGIYRNAQKANEKSKPSADNLRSIVILSALGGSEIHPVDAEPDVINGGLEEHGQTEESKEDEKNMEASHDKLQSNECAV